MKKLRTLIETALQHHHNVFDLDCHDIPQLMQDFLSYHQFTSRACYHWKPGCPGLARIDMPHIVVPQTSSFEQALKHISSRPHFAIYLFEGVKDEFKLVSTWAVLRPLIANRSSQRKLLFFAGGGVRVPDHMRELFVEASIYPAKSEASTKQTGTSNNSSHTRVA